VATPVSQATRVVCTAESSRISVRGPLGSGEAIWTRPNYLHAARLTLHASVVRERPGLTLDGATAQEYFSAAILRNNWECD
jgi:hypothetical protein